MHIFDVETHFQGGWALVAEQFPYAAGAARSIMLDRHLGLAPEDDDRLAIVFCGEGGSQNGRLAEVMNCAAKEKLPLLILCIDNGRAINTFTPDVAQNSEVWKAGAHYGVPGAKVDGTNLQDVLRTGRAVVDYVRETSSPAILQVHTYRLQGHSPADPEHERGRKAEKKWARGGRPAQDLRGDGGPAAGRPRRPQEEGFRSSEGGRGLREREPAAAAGAGEGIGIPGSCGYRLQHARGRQR